MHTAPDLPRFNLVQFVYTSTNWKEYKNKKYNFIFILFIYL